MRLQLLLPPTLLKCRAVFYCADRRSPVRFYRGILIANSKLCILPSCSRPHADIKRWSRQVPGGSSLMRGCTTAAATERAVDFSRLDIRVGRIVSAEKHPDAERLYVEQIDVGEDVPRTVVSGLVGKVPLEELIDRLVVVICNLKPAKMRGVKSTAMLLCATQDEDVELLTPPITCSPGDRVFVAGFEFEALGGPDAVLNPKKKVFEQVQEHFSTASDGVASYKGLPWQTKCGVVRTKTLFGAIIR